jgi:hypothetical protein
MKKKILCIIFSLVLVQSTLALCEQEVWYKAQWPYGPIKAVAVDNDTTPSFVFLGDGDIITILDLNLNRQASYEIPTSVEKSGEVSGIFYTSNLLYIAFGSGGLKILDVSDRLAPHLEGELTGDKLEELSGISRDVYVSGDFAYILEIFFGGPPQLTKVDISDPSSPDYKGTCLLPSYIIDPREVFVSGDYALIADTVSGLQVIDVSSATLTGSDYVGYILAPAAMSVYVADSYAYIARGSIGVDIVDVSDLPNSAPTIRTVEIPGEAATVHVTGNYAYVADWSGFMHAIDVTEATDPELVDISLVSYENEKISGTHSVYVAGNNAYFTNYRNGLQQIDVSDLEHPELNGTYDTPADALAVYVTEYVTEDSSTLYAYVVDDSAGTDPGEEGLRIIEVLDFSPLPLIFPELKGFCATPGDAQDIFVSGDYAYVADGGSGLQIINVSDKANASISKNVATTEAKGVYVYGDYAYIADGSGGLQIINITTPTSPGSPVPFDTNGDAKGVHVSGKYAYVAEGGSGLQIIDVSDPTQPSPVATLDTTDAQDVFVSGIYAYVADGAEGLRVIDVATEPTSPKEVGSLDTAGSARGVHVSGELAYVVDGSGGFLVIDISDPTNPQEARSTDTPGDAQGVYVFRNFAYVADGSGGLVVLEHNYDPEAVEIEEDSEPPTIASSGCFISAAVCDTLMKSHVKVLHYLRDLFLPTNNH